MLHNRPALQRTPIAAIRQTIVISRVIRSDDHDVAVGLRSGHSDFVLNDETLWQTALRRWDITDKRHVQVVTEGALLASVLSHGVSSELVITGS